MSGGNAHKRNLVGVGRCHVVVGDGWVGASEAGGWGMCGAVWEWVARRAGVRGGGRVKGADDGCGGIAGIGCLNSMMYLYSCDDDSTRDGMVLRTAQDYATRFCFKAWPFAGILKGPLCQRTKTPSGGVENDS